MTNRRPALAAWIVAVALSCCALAQEAPIRDRLKWSELPPLPQVMSGHFAGVVEGSLVVAGGSYFEVSPWQGGEKIWLDGVYALGDTAGTWTETTSLPHALAYGGMGSVAKGMVLAGGSDGQQHYAATYLLTRSGDRFELSDLPDLPEPCAFSGSAVLGNTIYVAGGQRAPDSTEPMHTFWALDTSMDDAVWQALACVLTRSASR